MSERNLYEVTGDIKDINTLLVSREEWNRRAQPAQAGQVLTEGEIVKCLVAAGCVGTVKMTYDSGPYEITRTSINADRFARAIEQAVMAKWVPMPTRRVTYTCPACHFSLERAE